MPLRETCNKCLEGYGVLTPAQTHSTGSIYNFLSLPVNYQLTIFPLPISRKDNVSEFLRGYFPVSNYAPTIHELERAYKLV